MHYIEDTANTNIPLFTVSQYVSYINEIVSYAPVFVEGEVSNYRAIPGRPYCYFDIKDKGAVAKCFHVHRGASGVVLENGIKIKVLGNPKLQKNGTLVIQVQRIIPVGKGALMEAYLRLKAQLEAEGIFDLRYKKTLPEFPKRVGLIAGKNSSAYEDVTSELEERWQGLEIFFYPTKVQGILAEKEITRAIAWFNANLPVDVLIIARGGGSIEDLWAFNTEEVVRQIFASNIPIISAIGHEDHWTLADFVADMRAKTPTKAAELAVPSKKEIQEKLMYFSHRMNSLVLYHIQHKRDALKSVKESMQWLISGSIVAKRQSLKELFDSLVHMAQRNVIEKRREKLIQLDGRLESLDPLKVLRRGYCVVEKKGKRVTSIEQIKIGDETEMTLSDGIFGGRVEKVKKTNEFILHPNEKRQPI